MCKPCSNLQRSLSTAGKIFLIPFLVRLLVGCQVEAPLFPKTPLLPEINTAMPSATASLALPSATLSPTQPSFSTATPFPPLAELPISDISYVLPLMVQQVSERSAQLLFELDRAATGDLLLRKVEQGNELVQVVPISSINAYQQINLEPLEPGAAYEVLLGLRTPDGTYAQPTFLGEAWGSVCFRTQPTAEPLRVGVIGDSGFGEPVTTRLAEQMAGERLDFVIHTGDVVYNAGENASPAEAFALKYFRPFASLLHQLPIYAVPGNHEYAQDVRIDDVPYYYHVFPPLADPGQAGSSTIRERQYYALVYQNIQFIFLDSQVFFGEAGKTEQEEWLDQRLKDDQFKYSVVITHVPPFTSSIIHPADSLPVRQAWHNKFAGAHVPLVLSGHSHNYERLSVDGVTYVVTGGGSDALYPALKLDPHSQAFAVSSHFVLLEFYQDRIQITAIDKDGKVLDEAQVPVR